MNHQQVYVPNVRTVHCLTSLLLAAIIFSYGCRDTNAPGLVDSLDPTQSPIQVINTFPNNEDQDIEPDVSLQVTFSTAVDTTTVTDNTFFVTDNSEIVSGSFSYSDSSIVFIPAQEFARNSLINATITSDVADMEGNVMTQNYEWSFKTRPPTTEEITPPSIVSTYPSHGASNISITTDIRAYFDKSLNETTVNSNTFLLSVGGRSVDGSVIYTDSVVIFDPTVSLEEDQIYKATITTGIEDRYGNSLVGELNWNFKTREPDRTPPRIIDTSPEDDEENVDTDTNIRVTFNEPMNAATLTSDSFVLYKRRQGEYRQVSGTVSYENKIATLTPDNELREDTDYIVLVKTSITDVAGNELSQSYYWSFATGED